MLLKKEYINILQGWGGGGGGSGGYCQRSVENGGFSFLHQILYTRRLDSPVMMLIQIRNMGSGGIPPPPPPKKKFYLNGAILSFSSVPKK